MSVVASDLLAAAQKACIHADCEADWRGVLSRSYYAVYQDGLAFHNSLPVPGSLNPISNGGIHEDLIEFLKNPGIPKASAEYSRSRRVGTIMAALHTSRVKADYKRDILIPSEDAANSLAHADMVLKLLSGGAIPPVPVLSSPLAVGSHPVTIPSNGRPTLTRIK